MYLNKPALNWLEVSGTGLGAELIVGARHYDIVARKGTTV